MQPNWYRDKAYGLVRFFGVWAPILVMVVCGLMGLWKPDSRLWPKWVLAVHEFFGQNSRWLCVVLPSVIGGSILLAKAIGEPWFWRTVDAILNDFQRDVFADLAGDRTDDHRVTLYKWVKYCWWPGNRGHVWWPWGRGNWAGSGWLKPIMRSGVYKRGRTVFLAKKHEPSTAEGVVGSAFFASGDIEIDNLPDVQQQDTGKSSRELSGYAEKTFVSEEWLRRRVKKHAPVARSFRAIRIEVRKVRWGVVMIDSRAAKIPNPQTTKHKFRFLFKTLERLLERI